MAGREKNCKWYFADQPNGQEVGPNNALEQNFKKHPYASLVRESIQNSLDAVLDKTKPVRVIFSFNEIKGVDFPEFFELKQHIKGCIDYYPKNAKAEYEPMLKLMDGECFREQVGFIRVSDFNTKGMWYEANNTDSPFYAFVRSAGVTVKEDVSAGGSFGFGKAAYYLLSPIKTIIVSTCTDKYQYYFEGASSLCTHLYKGIKKMAFGYYDDQNGNPISRAEDIPSKFRRELPGTDINIMGFDTENTNDAVKEMTESVLRNFWMAIYNGKLEVEIGNGVQIDKDSIEGLMEEYFIDDDDKTAKAGYSNPRPYFDAVRFAKSSEKYQFFEQTLPILGHVCLYLMKKKGAVDKVAYMRAPQMLVFSRKNKTNYGLYGVFFCDGEKGNDLLRQLETPAHDEWKADNWRMNGKIVDKGKAALQEMSDFVANCMSQAFSLKDKVAIDIKDLEEFLYIPTTYDEEDDRDAESLTGKPTGGLQDEGTSVTTDLPKDESNPTITKAPNANSTGHVMINRMTQANNEAGGDLHTGRGETPRKSKKEGIQKPGNARETRTEDENGERGIFASPIIVPYRAFSQVEDGKVFHYVILHSDEEVGNVRLHFFAVGEEIEEELNVVETNIGNISGNVIRDIHVEAGRLNMKVRFADNMKHAIKLSAEELYEV